MSDTEKSGIRRAAPHVDAALRATRRIAPLWPLERFVAVNPFVGLADASFEDAARMLALVAGARTTLPRSEYLRAIDEGRITDEDFDGAFAEGDSCAALRALAAERAKEADAAPALVPTVADVVSELTGRDWSRLCVERIAAWASSYFDEGWSSWTSPFRDLSPYAAWLEEAAIDRTPEASGAPGIRRIIAQLPRKPEDLVAHAVVALGVPESMRDLYLLRLLQTVPGWSAHARWRVWEAELHGGSDATAFEVLAVRLAWDVVLLEAFAKSGSERAWREACGRFVETLATATNDDLALDHVLHAALERSYQRRLVAALAAPKRAPRKGRRAVQAVFCIDVRSEVFRRALESVDRDIETLGFAGFFGFGIEWVPLGQARGGKQCPVLLTPKHVVHETVRGASEDEVQALGEARVLRRRASAAWKSFKTSAVACFGFVGPVGLAFARKLVTDALGLTRPALPPALEGLDARTASRLVPSLEPRTVGGRRVGLTLEERVAVAEGVLGAMSLRDGFARVVLLAGHGSTSVNNPYASGLDCGACGGHTGEANARVAALVLNDAEVRHALAARGLHIPGDTVFVAGLHDTTTDELRLFDREAIPASHARDLARLEEQLASAGVVARRERARRLDLDDGARVDEAVVARSRDWSQVRPEWGLAGCAAFVVAPRHRTEGVDFGGRAFLHSYDWRKDAGFSVLELVMTAPMVVGSWISLQYFASAVDGRAFGSGNKVLHDVVGTLGIAEGNAGDLRVGLPWQSVHDGTGLVHEPQRLNVVIEAPVEAMNAVLAKHEDVRRLLDNGWLHLWAMDDAGMVSHRYRGGLVWEPVLTGSSRVAA